MRMYLFCGLVQGSRARVSPVSIAQADHDYSFPAFINKFANQRNSFVTGFYWNRPLGPCPLGAFLQPVCLDCFKMRSNHIMYRFWNNSAQETENEFEWVPRGHRQVFALFDQLLHFAITVKARSDKCKLNSFWLLGRWNGRLSYRP